MNLQKTPTEDKKTYKLDADQRLFLISLLAEFKSGKQVKKIIKDKFGVDISEILIYKYKQSEKWKPMIDEMRKAYLSQVSEVAGAHKRVRMERLEEIFFKAMASNKISEARSAVESQRVEIEGKDASNDKSPFQFNLTMNQFYNMTKEQLEEKKKELVAKISLLSDHKEVIDVSPDKAGEGNRNEEIEEI